MCTASGYDEVEFERKLFEIKQTDTELNRYNEQHKCHVIEKSKLKEELEELEIKTKGLKRDDENAKTFSGKLTVTQLKWKLADSKRWMANAQRGKRRCILRKEQLKQVGKDNDKATRSDVQHRMSKVEEELSYWKEQIKNWESQVNTHEKTLKQCIKKGEAAKSSEELSSWREAWESQVYQIHKSQMSEEFDIVKPVIAKSTKRISADDVTLQGLKDPGSSTGTSSIKKVSLPQFFKREEVDSDANTIAILFKPGHGVIPFKAVVSSLTKDDSLGWHSLNVCDREAKFRIKRAFDMTMSYYNRPMAYLEIRVSKAGDSALFLEDACAYVRENVEKKLATTCTKEAFSLAFFCTCSQISVQHMMKVEEPTPLPPTRAVCDYRPLDQNLSEGTHLVWFAPSFKEFNFDKRGDLILLTPVPNLQEKKKIRLVSADIEKVVEVDYSQAIIKNRTFEGQPDERVIEQSNKFTNNSKSTVEHNWSYTSLHSSGGEKSRTKSKGWGVGGEIKPMLSIGGIGTGLGGLSASYGRHSETSQSSFRSKSNEKKHEMKFTVPAKSTVIVKLLEISQNYKGTVENVSVSFNPKTKVKCRVQKVEDTSGKEEEKQYELQDLFYLSDQPIPNKSKVLQWSVSPCYEWKEIHTTVRVDKVSD